MEHTIYFRDKSLTFSPMQPSDGRFVHRPCEDADLSRAKVLKILDIHNHVVILAEDPDAAFARFATEFTQVEAAGGVVINPAGEWLMIHRNARWDLPKGHVEAGETYDRCAAREIAEETGVVAEVLRPLCRTWHAYYFEPTARWELKRTHWYLLRTTDRQVLQPQHEEGITEVVWCDRAAVDRNLQQSFPTIVQVVEAVRSLPA